MKVNETVKNLPSREKVILNHENNYIVTQNTITKVYSLFKKESNGYTLLKTRKNNPLFKECGY